MEGSVTMEGTPPQMLAGVSPSSLKVFATHFFLRDSNVIRGSKPPADHRA